MGDIYADQTGALLQLDGLLLENDDDDVDNIIDNYQDGDDHHHHYHDNHRYKRCDLTHIPNWSYSYALALRRMERHNNSNNNRSSNNNNNTNNKISSTKALVNAIKRFPEVPGMLLAENNKNVTSGNNRSCLYDWPLILQKLDHYTTIHGG